MIPVIHIISNRDQSGGTIAATNLHNSLTDLAYPSSLLSTDILTGHLNGDGYRRFGGITGHLQNAFIKIENILARPGFINPIDALLIKKELKNYKGIIHIHVTHIAQTSFKLLEYLSQNNKVFWTLHDLWPLTAKCIHPTYCSKWLNTCNECPKLKEYPSLKWDNTPNLYHQKHNFIQQHKIHFIAPSQWIQDISKDLINKSSGNIDVISHGIDTHLFKADTKSELKEKLQLDSDETVIFFPQGRWDDEKKGSLWYDEIIRLFSSLQTEQKFIFLKISGNEINIKKINKNFKEISLPFAQNKLTMASYYQLANVTVSLSEVETFGLCVAESLSCKVPVIARKAFGVDELLNYSNQIMAESPKKLFHMIYTKSWQSFNYQNLFEKDFSYKTWAKKHIELYAQL